MRITCPNCLAQYEIEADLLSADGRDVQCSACDHVWFQAGPARKTFRASAVPEADGVPPKKDTHPPVAAAAAPGPEESDTFEAHPKPDTPQTPSGLRKLDPSVSEILKEEARFAEEAQKRERAQVEVQPDLGLLGGGPWPTASRPEHPTDTRTDMPEARLSAPPAFPDIDDVSATLEPLGARQPQKGEGYELPATAQERQRSFLSGFAVPLAIGLVLVLLYLIAPIVAAALPASAPLAHGYVQAVNSLRTILFTALGMN